jgi:hypothetical protein
MTDVQTGIGQVTPLSRLPACKVSQTLAVMNAGAWVIYSTRLRDHISAVNKAWSLTSTVLEGNHLGLHKEGLRILIQK